MGMLMAIASASASIQAGRAKEAAYKRDAERESFAAKDKEIQRKKRSNTLSTLNFYRD